VDYSSDDLGQFTGAAHSMSLNLINDPWIPVRMRDGSIESIAPHRMVEPDILEPAWPRADLNLACYELLIGLVMLACPPKDPADWRARRTPDGEALRAALHPFAPAFDLTEGDHPFLQELLETNKPEPVDVLFIDSAGENTAELNKDIMVWRDRYDALEPELAAMALYTMQAFAPGGGRGNRASMRGKKGGIRGQAGDGNPRELSGGVMVTLIDPGMDRGLWPLIWANVPYGAPAHMENLPWMRPVRTSKPGSETLETYPQHGHPVEAFFGMPRRLRLVEDGERVTRVLQKPHGTNYLAWQHPTSPYYSQKAGGELSPVPPKPGAFGYRNWLGILVRDYDEKELHKRAYCVEEWMIRRGQYEPPVSVRVAGWAMDCKQIMKPLTFVNSIQPLIVLPTKDHELVLFEMIRVADKAGQELKKALQEVLLQGAKRDKEKAKKFAMREAVVEEFFTRTEPQFHARLGELKSDTPSAAFAALWISDLREVALDLFNLYSVPGLDQRTPKIQETIVKARNILLGTLKPEKFTSFTETVAMLGEDAT